MEDDVDGGGRGRPSEHIPECRAQLLEHCVGSQHRLLTFLLPLSVSQVDYLRTMAANTKPLILCGFLTGAPRALGKIDDSLALFESRAPIILRVG